MKALHLIKNTAVNHRYITAILMLLVIGSGSVAAVQHNASTDHTYTFKRAPQIQTNDSPTQSNPRSSGGSTSPSTVTTLGVPPTPPTVAVPSNPTSVPPTDTPALCAEESQITAMQAQIGQDNTNITNQEGQINSDNATLGTAGGASQAKIDAEQQLLQVDITRYKDDSSLLVTLDTDCQQ